MIFQQKEKLDLGSHYNIREHKLELLNMEKNVDNMDPKNVLKRGFSITLHNGKVVSELLHLKHGDILQTLIFEGEIKSEVKEIKKAEN